MAENAAVVSVIVAAHDVAATIVPALRSVLDADGPAIEVLVVDDASADATVERVRGLGDPRVRLLEAGPVNVGPAAARNRALAEARGAWIAILDADDWFEGRRLAWLLAQAVEHGADLCADNLRCVRAPGETAWSTLFSPREVSQPKWLDAVGFVTSNTPGSSGPRLGLLKPLVRRAFLERHGLRWDERLRYTEDFLLYGQCLLAGARFRLLPEARYAYRADPGFGAKRRTERQLTDALEANRTLLEAARSAAMAELVTVLERRGTALARDVTYRQALEMADRRNWAGLLRTGVRDPHAIAYLAARASRSLVRRARRRSLGLVGQD